MGRQPVPMSFQCLLAKQVSTEQGQILEGQQRGGQMRARQRGYPSSPSALEDHLCCKIMAPANVLVRVGVGVGGVTSRINLRRTRGGYSRNIQT